MFVLQKDLLFEVLLKACLFMFMFSWRFVLKFPCWHIICEMMRVDHICSETPKQRISRDQQISSVLTRTVTACISLWQFFENRHFCRKFYAPSKQPETKRKQCYATVTYLRERERERERAVVWNEFLYLTLCFQSIPMPVNSCFHN